MKTKLEVGKEYWLSARKISRGIYLGESNSGNFDFRITLGSKHTKPLGELDVMTSNLSVYSEYIPEKQWRFTTPIAMKCTEEQFNEIKDRLVEMGYKISTFSRNSGQLMCTNFGSDHHYIGMSDLPSFQELVLESFNPDLFLALAAMTDKEDGIKGEWWKNPYNNNLFIQTNTSPNSTHPYLRKATAQEIIEHFEKKEFVLPENFKVPRDSSNFEEINRWALNNSIENFNCKKGFIYFYNKKCTTIKKDCPEITFEQFKKYVLKETSPYCHKEVEFAWNPCAKEIEKMESYLSGLNPISTETWHINDKKEVVLEDKTIIHIPPTKQATIFDDRVEITDWRPKEGEAVWVVSKLKNSFEYKKYIFDASIPFEDGEKVSPFIKRTESEAKQLVEKLKQAML